MVLEIPYSEGVSVFFGVLIIWVVSIFWKDYMFL